jgi:hypothetical protein
VDSDDSDPRVHKKRKLATPPQKPIPPNPPEQFSFVLIREVKKMVKKGSADYRLMDRDNVVYFGHKLRGDDGIAISDSLEPSHAVLAVVQKQNKGKRATVINQRLQKPFDDRPAEILGMAFVHLPERKPKARSFRVALPKSGVHFPVSETRELARMAESGESSQQIQQYTNIAAHGNVANPFGNAFLVESVKNFAVFDENGQVVFMIYKSAEGSFTVKAKSPFTPLTAFALGLVIISH